MPMKLNRRRTFPSLVAALSAMTWTKLSVAALLGILVSFPIISYNGTGVTTYSAGTDLFSINASPIAIRFSALTPPRIINPTGFPPAEVLQINVQVDNSGALIGGTPGDDLLIVGEVDADGNGSIDYAGTLLTGEVRAGGFGFLDTGTPTDQYDFRFKLTGGLLASFFAGKDIGVVVTSEASSFVNDFNVDFAGGAKGNVGAIDRLNTPPLCSANGPYQAECAGGTTQIVLDGTQSSDDDGDTLTYNWTSDCPNATFNDATSALPTLTVDTSTGCNITCSVTLVVSDGQTSSAPCTAQVTIEDTNAPSITCAVPEVTIECDQPTDTTPPTVHDDCDPNPTVVPSDVVTPGSCPQEKTIVRTWTATDRCSNSASCTQTIHVVDSHGPMITSCPANTSVTCTQGTDPSVTGSPTVSDNCDNNPAIRYDDVVDAGQCPIASIVTRTWTATDACGRSATCTQIITVTDTSAPTITCPPDRTLECGQSTKPSNTGTPTVSDSCDPHPAVTYCDQVCGNCPKIIRRTWRATDKCGNSATCVQTITVDDTTPPVITCPPDKTIHCGDSTNPCNTGKATATDNCDSCLEITYCDSSTGCGCPRTITRTWKAKDDCGNVATCTQIINVVAAQKCPSTPGYWKNHRSRWPVNSLTVGCVTYNDTQLMRLLSNKLPNGANAGSDMSAILAKFVIAATFNIMDGSDPQDIGPVLTSAHAFLCSFPPGSNPTGANRTYATQLKDQLDRYCNSKPAGCRERN